LPPARDRLYPRTAVQENDNAHIEQKNWTHVRRLLGWQRLDAPAILQVVNSLYRNELHLWMNYF